MPPEAELRWEIADLRAAPVTAENAGAVQRLLETDPTYFELVQNGPPGPAEAQSLSSALPAGKTYEDKFILALSDAAGEIVALIDLIRDYPEPGHWYLGLLFVAPDRRGAGLGARIVTDIEAALRAEGAVRLRMAAIERNTGALRFWLRQGFREERRTERKVKFDLTIQVLGLARDL